ncbi:hypothetical protein PP914_gp164 [Arthrobacter phage Qui]|jgi:hypothetical protein|uniref:Uncharacterized protein n=1 Tax=Arthrobacter phage Qui TaxID=2603260 RepID=A0A5B8WM11_9CAUD|nr:hypothetical protein PP914_gp164 [Arthrobacter phage Qui]QED11652.1 hypothetical protein SEA_QUI_164 [Arthrobacter phage Qui]QOC56483.1 hypothetical protein SEA_PAELLA_164 [Arthrobacter phage Paella]
MPTFRKKPEIVDARKFEGGVQNGTDLIFWVESKAGHALWDREVTGTINAVEGKMKVIQPEQIRLYEHPYSLNYSIAYIGDWIMQCQNGKFEVLRQQELDAEYEQV